MTLRGLLILAIVIQQTGLMLWAGRTAPRRCETTSCCQTIEYTTCCGEQVVEHRCHRTGSSTCLCGMLPEDSQAPRPLPFPGPGPGSDRGGDAIHLYAGPPSGAHIRQETTRPLPIRDEAAPGRSHNRAQATLCVWRT